MEGDLNSLHPTVDADMVTGGYLYLDTRHLFLSLREKVV